MAEFQIGDRVVCTFNRTPHKGSHGIIKCVSGSGRDTQCTVIPDEVFIPYYYITAKWLELETPPSLFEQKVRAYIRWELPNG